MSRKYFFIRVGFALWTIIQTSAHLVFVVYSYYLRFCLHSPTQAPAIFFYLTYFYHSKCPNPILENSADLSVGTSNGDVLRAIKASSTEAPSFNEMVADLLNQLHSFPDYVAPSSRASVFLLCFIILDSTWIVSAVSLLMGTCCDIKQSLSLLFNGPWLVITLCVSIFDVAASISFGLDIAETTNFANWLKFVGINDPSQFQDFDAKNLSVFVTLAPTLMLCAMSCRFVICWIINWIGFTYVFKATISVYRDKYKNPDPTYLDSPPNRRRPDPDSSSARIRSWQLFYGATDTTSTPSRKSVETEMDLNSNSQDKEVQFTAEAERQQVSSVSGSYFAYSDVCDIPSESERSPTWDELRNQLPWTYIPPQEDVGCLNGEIIELEKKPRRNYRIRSDSSIVSGTEL